MSRKITLTRKQLYERVWSTPSAKLAGEFGFSDVALGKLCKKFDIPKPPLGYWARVQNGQKVERPPLPDSQPEDLLIEITERYKLPSLPAMASPKVNVSSTFEDSHPYISLTLQQLKNCKEDSSGIRWRSPNSGLDVAVSEKNIERALRILDAMLKSLVSFGGTLEVISDKEGGKTRVSVYGEPIEIQMRETTTRQALPSTTEEHSHSKKSPWLKRTPQFEEIATGFLSIRINTKHGHGFQKHWSESEKRPLEGSITGIVNGILRAATVAKEEREKHETWERDWAESERIEAERKNAEREENNRIEGLRRTVLLRERHLRILQLVEEVESRFSEQRLDEQSDPILFQWLKWVKSYARSIDPVAAILAGNPEALKKDHWDDLEKNPSTHFSSLYANDSEATFWKGFWTGRRG